MQPQESSFRESMPEEPEETAFRPPPIPEVVLRSKLTWIPDFWTWGMVATAISTTSFSVYYAWNAAFRQIPSRQFYGCKQIPPFFTINILSYIATVMFKQLIDTTCDQIRWSRGCQKGGISFLSFLALSSATTTSGLIHLLLSPIPRLSSFTTHNLVHRVWSFQRYDARITRMTCLDCCCTSF
jgi:hypothetical protein